MAVTKILARKGRLDVGIRYVLNGDKTQEQVLTARLNCEPGREVRQMLETKRDYGKEDRIQYYHMIQSFCPGEITPELALEIAKEFAAEHLPGYQAVIGVHVDKEHIHAHILFNSVNADTGQKYHSSAQSYYRQIRAISDRLCREHGLSVLMQGEASKAVSYIEWLRQSKGQATFRSMLEADLQEAIQDANDLGHFFLLMEHKGYEIKHGTRLGFRLQGQERFMISGRKNPMFTEEGIRAAIQGNLSAIEAGVRPAVLPRPSYRPYVPHPKYKGFLALYVHYLCGGGCRTLFPWGDGMDYSMRLHHFEDMEEAEDRPYDMEEPNFFGLSIAYDPYMQEIVKAEQFTTCGGDGGCNICGGMGMFLGYLPCSPHCKPEVQEDKELNGDYDFCRPIIRVEMDG